MKIDYATFYTVKMALKNPFRTSFGIVQEREILLICLQSGDFKGWGECITEKGPWYSSETTDSCVHIITKFIMPLLKGSNIEHPTDYPPLVKRIRGNQMAKACIEDALWDLYGKIEEKCLKTLIGGEKQQIEAGISLGIQKEFSILLSKIKDALKQGYQRIKIKIEPGWDVDIVKQIRDNYPEIKLMVDANSAYKLKDKEIFLALDRFDLMMIEQPLQYYDIIDHATLQKEIKTPICLDESIKSVDDARTAVEIGATRIINVKPSRVSGITETLKIHELAKLVNLPLWCGGMLETGIGRAKNIAVASLSSFKLPNDLSESSRYYTEYIIKQPFKMNKEGFIQVPDVFPGLGVLVDEEKIKQLSNKKMEI